MSCNAWKDEWVAWIYDEVDPSTRRVIAEHLESCSACRESMQKLESSREMLQRSAAPVPAAPRVLVLQSKRFQRPGWAFAGGFLAAAALFAFGLFTGPLLWEQSVDPDLSAALEASLARIEQQSAELAASRGPATQPAVLPASTGITQQELNDSIEAAIRRTEVSRARDFQFLIGEITAVEYRADRDLRSRDAIIQTMLTSNPGFAEH